MKNEQRIVSLAELKAIVQDQKAAGKKVVFTNGIYDFIHPGHAALLEKAKTLGDVLIVGLNSDASTKRIKGPERPINPQEDRCYILSALRSVDYVSLFEEDTASAMIEALKPDIYCKGGDYTIEAMPETKVIQAYGGHIEIIPLIGEYSNSRQYKKIKAMRDLEGQRAAHISKRS